ncbi:MAG: PrsW family glutamic-type intramembrane protease [Vicinamibacterales bacterium]
MPTLTIGRATTCDITLADPTVSSHHATLEVDADGRVLLRDDGSANGTTLVRGQERRRLTSEEIVDGDEVEFGDLRVSYDMLIDMALPKLHAAPEIVAPAPIAAPPPVPPVRPAPAVPPRPAGPGMRVRLSDFNPLAGGLSRMRDRGLLLPSLAFALITSRLYYLYAGFDDRFLTELAVYTCLGSLLFVYRLCGKHQSWLVVGAVMLAEFICLSTLIGPLSSLFCDASGAMGPNGEGGFQDSSSLIVRWYAFTVCAGFREELIKMAPVFGLIVLSGRGTAKGASRWRVSEPLDTIFFACAAATTFILLETLGQYVPMARGNAEEIAMKVAGNQDAAFAFGELRSVELALLRTLDALTGHFAYSAYFAYYVGLGLLRREHRWPLLGGGLLSASLLHGFFDAANSTVLQLVATIVSMFVLIAVVLNARKISPTRADNFATVSLHRARAKRAEG